MPKKASRSPASSARHPSSSSRVTAIFRKRSHHSMRVLNECPIVSLTASLFMPKSPVVMAERAGFEPATELLALRRSEEHTSELQSRSDLVCRLLLEKKKHPKRTQHRQHTTI